MEYREDPPENAGHSSVGNGKRADSMGLGTATGCRGKPEPRLPISKLERGCQINGNGENRRCEAVKINRKRPRRIGDLCLMDSSVCQRRYCGSCAKRIRRISAIG